MHTETDDVYVFDKIAHLLGYTDEWNQLRSKCGLVLKTAGGYKTADKFDSEGKWVPGGRPTRYKHHYLWRGENMPKCKRCYR